MTKPVWLEVSLNGGGGRKTQPLMPVSVAEIVAEGIACAKAGAAILHLHAYDAATGRQKDDPAIYAAIIRGIRAEVDAIVYPTLPFIGTPDAPFDADVEQRHAAMESLARDGLIEWGVVDPGSVNFTTYRGAAGGRPAPIYKNPEAQIRYGLELCARHGLHPAYAIYEPGFLRAGAALARRYPGLRRPVYRLMFTEAYTFGFPPAGFALDAYRALMRAEGVDGPWMIAGLGVDLRPLIADTVRQGGHVRVGIEDAPLGSTLSNLEWTRAAAEAIGAAGGRLASAAEIRAALQP